MSIVNFKKPDTATIEPLRYISIDIETCNASEDTIAQELELWKPPSNWKPETIEKNRAEQAVKIREKSALLDSAPVATIGIADDSGEVVVFHWLLLESGMLDGFLSVQTENERDMLIKFREWANDCTNESTTIVGFNLGFDLPHLRIAYTRHGLKLPALALVPRSGNQIADVMYLFTKYFTTKDVPFIGLGEVSKRLGIAQEGKQLDGADVPVYIAQGFKDGENNKLHCDVITYNAIDVLLTMRTFMICTGQSGD